ncbi:MAG: site-specific integrase [Clostridiales bacterium]|nr:site-specific integrase [Clostridiales bacterium]
MAKKNRNAHGSGTIRHRADGLWEARFTYTDDLGQPRRGSVYAPTQKECRQKLTATLRKIDAGDYHGAAKRYTVEAWLNEWLSSYCVNLKPASLAAYQHRVRTIIPYLGKIQLSALTNTQCQRFVVKLSQQLSPKSVKCVHGVLHAALEQAMVNGLITHNPADHCRLPTVRKPDLHPIIDDDVPRFLDAIKGVPDEQLFFVALFTGLRQSELLGLQWSDISFEDHTLHVCRQLQRDPHTKEFIFLTPKHDKTRLVNLPGAVEDALKAQRRKQAQWKLAAGAAWSNPNDLVFTNELGGHLFHDVVRKHFKKVVASIGLEDVRFHDLRHSYAINALQIGDNPQEVCDALGHYSSAFTMDVYGGISQTAREESRERLDDFIRAAKG